MNVRRLMAIAVTACAAGLSVAACSVGVSSADTAASPSPATSHVASSPTASPSHTGPAPADSGDTLTVDAPIRSFPIPHGAQVVSNMICGNGKQILIQLGSVTPARAQAFYTSALPRAGYTITVNNLTTDPDTGIPQGMAEIMFTGHGYTGFIGAFAKLSPGASAGASPISLPDNITKNGVVISLVPSALANKSAPTC